MIIESKPMLKRMLRAHNAYMSVLERAIQPQFIDPRDPNEQQIDVNVEIECTDDMIRAIENELFNKH